MSMNQQRNIISKHPLRRHVRSKATVADPDAPFPRTAHIQVDAWAVQRSEVTWLPVKCITSAEVMRSGNGGLVSTLQAQENIGIAERIGPAAYELPSLNLRMPVKQPPECNF